jgi:hypothetical protein
MNISRSNIALFLFLQILFTSCIEPFNPPKTNYEYFIVIEGTITDSPEPQIIRISRTIPLDTILYVPDNTAKVSILDDSGNEYLLQSTGNGEYATSWPDFQATPGQTYQLHVITENGEIIQSDPVTMMKVPDIDSVSWKITSRFNDEGQNVPGVQIYISTHDPGNNTRNYRWELEETWEFTAPYHSFYQWSSNGWVEMRPENIYTCWTTNLPDNILIGSSAQLSDDIISEFPLLYISSEGSNRLSEEYSLLVRQYALSESSRLFWQQMKKMNEAMGSLFAPQPSAVTGNLHNISNEGEPVIGYFDASEVKETRIFIPKEELEDMNVFSGYYGCTKDTLLMFEIPHYDLKSHTNPIDEVKNDMGFTVGFTISNIECTDCTLHGTNIKPDFWQ